MHRRTTSFTFGAFFENTISPDLNLFAITS